MTSCTTVGMRHDGGAYEWRSLIERTTDGEHWTVASTPKPEAGWTGNQLESVELPVRDAVHCSRVRVGQPRLPDPRTFAAKSLILRTTQRDDVGARRRADLGRPERAVRRQLRDRDPVHRSRQRRCQDVDPADHGRRHVGTAALPEPRRWGSTA